ncbi:MAG: T9SS type A sorting domain-containing protein, partial [Paludibacter sp.]
TFLLEAGATLKTSNTNGVAASSGTSGAVQTATKTFDAAANYEFNGTAAQTANNPTTANNVIISNTGGIVSITNSITALSGTFTVNPNATLNMGVKTIKGTGSFSLGTGATLNTANTNATPLTECVGQLTGTKTYNASANYIFSAVQTVSQSITEISSANNIQINVTGTPLILTLGTQITVNGTLTLTAGTLDLGTNNLTIKGATSGAGTINNSSTGVLIYNGSSAQTISNLTGNAVNNLTINNSAGVTLGGATTVNGTLSLTVGTFAITPGLTLGNSASIIRTAGSLSAVPTFGTAVNLSYNNTASQTTSYELPASSSVLNNLTINNAAGVTLNAATTVNGALTLTAGTLTNGTNLTLANSASIVCTAGTLSAVPTFGTAVNLSYNNTASQTTSYELPASSSVLNNLTISNAAGVTLNAATTLNGTLSLTSGTLTNGTNLTLANSASVVRTAGSLSAVPTFGTAVNLSYNGTSTKGNEFPAGDIINTLTANNTAGITLSDNRTIPNLTIGSGSSLTVNAGKQLSISTTMSNSGTLNLLSDGLSNTATILTPTTISGTGGTCNVNQYLGNARNWYISSPVSNAKAVSGYTYYQRDETGSNPSPVLPATAYWVNVTSGSTFTPGTGYIALPDATNATLTFSTETGGSLNTGNVPVSLTWSGVTSKGFNLIGNPYPSHLTWSKAFVDDATNAALIEPTIYYRTNTGSVNSGGDAAWSFKTYNSSTDEFSPAGTTNIIPPMQAFWVRAKAAGTLILDNKLTRSHQTSNPLKAPAVKNTDRQRVRLEVSNGISSDEALIYFDANASDNFDSYDSPKFTEASSVLQIFTTVGNEKLVINGMNSIPKNTAIGLGFVAGNATTFSLKASEISNFPTGVKVILKDNVTSTETDLTDGVRTYQFSPVATSSDRFSIIFRAPGVATGLDNGAKLNEQVFVNTANQIVVGSPDNTNVSIYNVMGQKQYENSIVSNKTTINKAFAAGVYFVYLSVNGKSEIQK